MSALKLRIIGVIIFLFNLYIIGEYNVTGIPVLLMTIGFAVIFEMLIVRVLSKKS